MAPPPFRSEGAGRGLVSPPQAGVEGHEVQGTRKAEARSRQAPIWAPISGHGGSGGIEERRLRPALPKRRRRDGERDGGPRDSRWRPHRSDKDRVSTYGTLQGKAS